MKRTNLLLLIGLIVLGQSCSKDEDFSCDKNTTINQNGEDICAHTIVTRHVVAGDLDPTDYETFDFNMKYGGTSILIGVNLYDRIIIKGEDYSGADTYYGGSSVSGDVVISILELDREIRTISLYFDFEGAFFDHSTSTSHDLNVTGNMTKINY